MFQFKHRGEHGQGVFPNTTVFSRGGNKTTQKGTRSDRVPQHDRVLTQKEQHKNREEHGPPVFINSTVLSHTRGTMRKQRRTRSTRVHQLDRAVTPTSPLLHFPDFSSFAQSIQFTQFLPFSHNSSIYRFT